jgi:hypothetical protein
VASTWKVGPQQQTTQLIPGGRFVRGVEISFVTGMGNSGTVFVPEDAYTPDAVRAEIQAKAEKMDAVSSLGA